MRKDCNLVDDGAILLHRSLYRAWIPPASKASKMGIVHQLATSKVDESRPLHTKSLDSSSGILSQRDGIVI